jgi:hypothetical protein
MGKTVNTSGSARFGAGVSRSKLVEVLPTRPGSFERRWVSGV